MPKLSRGSPSSGGKLAGHTDRSAGRVRAPFSIAETVKFTTVITHDSEFQGSEYASRAYQGIVNQGVRRQVLLDSTETLGYLAALSSHRLASLQGDRAGQHSIRINAQWRVCFRWTEERPCDVEIVDFHSERLDMNDKSGMRPAHPGKILRDELDVLELSANALPKTLGVPLNRVTMILNGQRGVNAYCMR